MLPLIAGAVISKPVEDSPAGTIALFVVWIILGVANGLFFHFNRDAALKRRVWRPFAILVGVLFCGFVFSGMGRRDPKVLLVVIPTTALITVLNIRWTRFCDACGRTLYPQPFLRKPMFCPHCGSEMK